MIKDFKALQRQASKSGLDLKDVFKKCSVSKSTYYRWRSGEGDWKMATYMKIIKYIEGKKK